MAVAKISVGKGGASGANAEYITRKKDAEKIVLKNLAHLEAKTLSEVRTNAIAHAYASQDIEQAINSKARTHYRMILSWERDETSDKIVEMAQKYLDAVLPKAKAIIAAHQDTNNPHAHIWVDARQTDDKKIQLNWKKFATLDEKFAELYDAEYGTNYAVEFKAKKEETRQFKKDMKVWRTKKTKIENKSELRKNAEIFVNGKLEELPPKPERSKRSEDEFDKSQWQEKDINKLGAINTDEQQKSAKGNRNAQGTDRNPELSEHQTGSSERLPLSTEHRLQNTHEGVERSEPDFDPAERNSAGTAQGISIETRPNDGTLREGDTDFGIQQGNQSNSAENEIGYQQHPLEREFYIPGSQRSSDEFAGAEISEGGFYQIGYGQDRSNGQINFGQTARDFGAIEIPRTIEIEPIELPRFEIDNSQLLINDILTMMNEHLERENRTMSDRATRNFAQRLESYADLPATSQQISSLNKYGEDQTTSDNEINHDDLSRLEAAHEILSKTDDETHRNMLNIVAKTYEAEAEQEIADEKAEDQQQLYENDMSEGLSMF